MIHNKKQPHLSSTTINKKNEVIKSYARLLTRFPNSSFIKMLNIPKSYAKLVEKEKGLELHKYTNSLTRDFYDSKEKIPEIEGSLPFTKKKNKIPKRLTLMIIKIIVVSI